MATYLRNSVSGWRLPHVPSRRKLSQAAYLPIPAAPYSHAHGYERAIVARLGRAVWNGARGRLGPPRP